MYWFSYERGQVAVYTSVIINTACWVRRTPKQFHFTLHGPSRVWILYSFSLVSFTIMIIELWSLISEDTFHWPKLSSIRPALSYCFPLNLHFISLQIAWQRRTTFSWVERIGTLGEDHHFFASTWRTSLYIQQQWPLSITPGSVERFWQVCW